MATTDIMYVRLPKEIREVIEKLAKRDERTLSTTLRIVIKAGIKALNGRAK